MMRNEGVGLAFSSENLSIEKWRTKICYALCQTSYTSRTNRRYKCGYCLDILVIYLDILVIYLDILVIYFDILVIYLDIQVNTGNYNSKRKLG